MCAKALYVSKNGSTLVSEVQGGNIGMSRREILDMKIYVKMGWRESRHFRWLINNNIA
jgi:hypothetical protein